MPTQYPYPAQGWSTGSMRKMGGDENVGEAAGAMGDHPLVDAMERMHKGRKKAQGDYPALTPEQWAAWQQHFPQGQTIDKDHPQLDEVAKTHDLYSIPNQWEKFLFMNPKQQQGGGPGPTTGGGG